MNNKLIVQMDDNSQQTIISKLEVPKDVRNSKSEKISSG